MLNPPTQGAVAALHMVQCFHLVGFPKGLISCVTGKGSKIGDFLTMHLGISCISEMIPLQMELGVKYACIKDACIVLKDADLDLVVVNIIKKGFSFGDQRCTTVKVVLVMEDVVETLVNEVNVKLTLGPPEENCDITPIMSESSVDFIEGLVMDAKKKWAKFCQENKREKNFW
eukprot:Gb_25464 [translate_table: standard]